MSAAFSRVDQSHMRRALALARAQLGRTAPNPSVGCVIAREDRILGEGATGAGGRPHAEEIALTAAGESAHGASAYVSLEPCARRTSGAPSCADLLVSGGVARVFVAIRDPHPDAAGGCERLRAAGVATMTGLRETEARTLNAGFFLRVETGRPLLVEDLDSASYDADFALLAGESLEAALDRLGQAGMNRVRVAPGTPLAVRARAAGLLR